MVKQKLIVVLSVCAVLGAWGTNAVAGARYRSDVLVQAQYRYAFGSMSSARDSSDSNQYIGCYVDTGIAVCHAQSSSGTFGMCYTTDPAKMTLARSLDSGSWLIFDWDANGVCTSIQVHNYSYYGNKTP